MPAQLSGLSVIVPAFNEEVTLEKVVRDILDAVPSVAREVEIIIIDDGSVDRTPEIADRLAAADTRVRAIHHPRNAGFGATQQTGFRAARFPFITLIPSDGQFPPRDVTKFLPCADRADIVLGYRTNRKDSPVRRLQTAVFKFVIRLFFGLPFRDINWVKMYRREAVAGLEIKSHRIGADTEVMVKVKRGGGRFEEVEVSYIPRRAGIASGSRPTVILKTLLELFRIWWDMATGKI